MSDDIKENIEDPTKKVNISPFFSFTLEELKQIPVSLGDMYKISTPDGNQQVSLGFTWTQVIRIINKAAGEKVIGWKTPLREAMPFINECFQG